MIWPCGQHCKQHSGRRSTTSFSTQTGRLKTQKASNGQLGQPVGQVKSCVSVDVCFLVDSLRLEAGPAAAWANAGASCTVQGGSCTFTPGQNI